VREEHIEPEGDLGVDSVKQTELMARVADRFTLPPDFAVADYPTLGHVADLVVGAAVVG
jgi:acyl carrier protein